MEAIDPLKEDLTIVLEQLRYFGKDVNVVDMFKKFKNIHEKLFDHPKLLGYEMKKDEVRDLDEILRNNFLDALSELRYMGFVS